MSDMTEIDRVEGHYVGKGAPLFALSIKTLLLTVLTLGIYRFWMMTRMRRYYWSSVQLSGTPFEYSGTGLEKLLGFLVAVVFLAIYLSIVQVVLTFVGISLFSGDEILSNISFNLSFLAVLPFIFYARYRARRYILSRSTWRGLRFGADQAAWSYAGQAMLHSFITLISLGLLYPRQTFKLEQFVTDRTWYGDLKFRQEGDWKMLYRAWIPVVLAVIFSIVCGAIGFANDNANLSLGAGLGLFAALIAFIRYNVASFRILTEHKVIGENIRLSSSIQTGKIILTYLFGAIGIGFIVFILTLIGGIFGAILGGALLNSLSVAELDPNTAGYVFGAAVIFVYFLVLLLMSALAEVFIYQPILRHYVEQTTILNAGEIEVAAQRPFDANKDAGGFADALDVGAAM